jgi:hypothetical protein
MQEVSVRDGKGEKDRMTLFPEALQTVMRDHRERVRMLHEHDLAAGYGRVYLPHALARIGNIKPLFPWPPHQRLPTPGCPLRHRTPP